jgi:hypothetical protein
MLPAPAVFCQDILLQERSSIVGPVGTADDWKGTYLVKRKELEEKRARVVKKVRGMWEEEQKRKDTRRIQV